MRFVNNRRPRISASKCERTSDSATMGNPGQSNEQMRRIFVLADTHDRLPERVIGMAQGADEIWHLGDVCTERILDELGAAGPQLTVVRGNCDSNFGWPLVFDLIASG